MRPSEGRHHGQSMVQRDSGRQSTQPAAGKQYRRSKTPQYTCNFPNANVTDSLKSESTDASEKKAETDSKAAHNMALLRRFVEQTREQLEKLKTQPEERRVKFEQVKTQLLKFSARSRTRKYLRPCSIILRGRFLISVSSNFAACRTRRGASEGLDYGCSIKGDRLIL